MSGSALYELCKPTSEKSYDLLQINNGFYQFLPKNGVIGIGNNSNTTDALMKQQQEIKN